MATKTIESKVEKLLEKIISDLGYSLYDVQYVKEGKDYYLRIFIDKENGISIEDCEIVNNAINDILDEANYIQEQYFLEVSSCGIEKNLRKKEHFIAQIGKEIEINLFKPIEKQKTILGILKDVQGENLNIECGEKQITLSFKDIAHAKTTFNFDN